MESGSHTVILFVYDLSNGMAKQFGKQFVGMDIEGIWHTGIHVYGEEYYYGGGICSGPPKGTPYGRPVKEIHLGETEIPKDCFMDFLRDISPGFTIDRYDLFSNNCNNFTDECAKFLIGKGIPDFIVGLPQEFLKTPIGQMLRPMIDGMKNQIIQNSHPLNLPGAFEGSDNTQALFPNASQPTQQAQQPAGGNNFGGFGGLGAFGGGGGSSIGGGNHDGTVIDLTTFDQFGQGLQKYEGCVVDCFSFTCPPCMRIKPVYEAIAQQYKDEYPTLAFYKCDTRGPAGMIAGQFEVKAIPTFLFFHKGQLVDRLQGADEHQLRSKVSALAGKCKKVPQFQLFNPKNREIYRFADKFDLPVNKIKANIEANPTFKTRDNEVFLKFSANPSTNVKTFTQDEKKALLEWLLQYLEVNSRDEFIPFYDLWRLLLAEDSFCAIYSHGHQAHFDQFVNNLVTKEKEFSRASRVFGYRAITNLFPGGAGKYLIKKHLAAVNEIVLGGFARYRDDKTGLVALTWLTYNIAATQSDINLQDADALKYIDTLCDLAEKEKDDRVAHGVTLSLINFAFEKPARIEVIKKKNIVTPLKALVGPSGNEHLRMALDDLAIVLDSTK